MPPHTGAQEDPGLLCSHHPAPSLEELSQDSDLAQGGPRPPAPTQLPDPHRLPALKTHTLGAGRLAVGPGSRLLTGQDPPCLLHTPPSSVAAGTFGHMHTCVSRLASPLAGGTAMLRGEFSGTSHFAAEHLHQTCPAEELPSPPGEATAGGTQAGSVAWWLGPHAWVHIPAVPFRAVRPRASLSASQSLCFPSVKLGK